VKICAATLLNTALAMAGYTIRPDYPILHSPQSHVPMSSSRGL